MQFSLYFGYVFMIMAVVILIGIYLFQVLYRCIKEAKPETKIA